MDKSVAWKGLNYVNCVNLNNKFQKVLSSTLRDTNLRDIAKNESILQKYSVLHYGNVLTVINFNEISTQKLEK